MGGATSGPWYSDGLRFACTQCGNCCSGAPGYVWVRPDEIVEIAAALAMPVEEFTRRHTRVVGQRVSLLERPGGDCEFLVREPGGRTSCSIHAHRPLQCRTWPFWDSNLATRQSWERAARGCPGMNNGPHHPLPVIEEARQRNVAARLPL